MTLSEATAIVGNRAVLFVDVKEPTMTRDEIHDALQGTKCLLIASWSLAFLRQLGCLPENWRKVLNIGCLLPISRMAQMQEAGVSAVELFHWNFTPRTIHLLRRAGIEVALSPFLLSRYQRRCRRHRALWMIANGSDYE